MTGNSISLSRCWRQRGSRYAIRAGRNLPEKTHGEIKRIEGKLGNEGFVAKAPEAVVAKEREKLEGYKETLAKLEEQKTTIAAL